MKPDDLFALAVFGLTLSAIVYFGRRNSRKRAAAPAAAAAVARLPFTIALIALCVAVAALSRLGASLEELRPLLISDPSHEGFSDIMAGQVWRVLTPAFIHFGLLHLLFNMMWLWDLGGLIERRRGGGFLASFLIVVGSASNLAQYLMSGYPLFGGMSGVVYGLLGYVWMQGRFNPRFGFALHQQTVVMMIGWFVLCWLGVLGPIANWAHTAGLLMGVALGYAQRNAP